MNLLAAVDGRGRRAAREGIVCRLRTLGDRGVDVGVGARLKVGAGVVHRAEDAHGNADAENDEMLHDNTLLIARGSTRGAKCPLPPTCRIDGRDVETSRTGRAA
jgi:hypothetical protein